MTVKNPALRYHGGKFRIAPWIIAKLPAHRCYVEPFGGAAGVLLQKQPSTVEVYNDLDDDIVNFFRVLQNPQTLIDLARKLEVTPYARREFELAFEHSDDPIERARRVCIRAQMGFGSGGATKGKTGFRTYANGRHCTQYNLWGKYPDVIHAVAKRFKNVLIECKPALQVIKDHDSDTTLHFVDPPYLPELRVMRGGIYRHEMSAEDHQEMLNSLLAVKGMVCLSGYSSEMYNDTLKGWIVAKKNAPAQSFRGTKMTVECLWLNPACTDRFNSQLF